MRSLLSLLTLVLVASLYAQETEIAKPTPKPLDSYQHVARWSTFDLGLTRVPEAKARELFPKLVDERLVFEVAIYPKQPSVDVDVAALSLRAENDRNSVERPLEVVDALHVKQLKLIKPGKKNDQIGTEVMTNNCRGCSPETDATRNPNPSVPTDSGGGFKRAGLVFSQGSKQIAIDPQDPDARRFYALQLTGDEITKPVAGYLVYRIPSNKKPLEVVYYSGREQWTLALGKLF